MPPARMRWRGDAQRDAPTRDGRAESRAMAPIRNSTRYCGTPALRAARRARTQLDERRSTFERGVHWSCTDRLGIAATVFGYVTIAEARAGPPDRLRVLPHERLTNVS